jgi:hypothetical protein
LRLFAGAGGHEGDTLLDVLLQVGQACLEQLLLGGVDLADGQDLLNTVGAKLDLGGEELNTLVLEQGAVDERRLNDSLLALGSTENALSHTGTSHGHGQSSGTGTILSLDNLVTTELYAVDELRVGAQVGVVALAEEGNNGDTGVTTNDGDLLVGRVGSLDLANESGSTNDVEGGDTEQALGVVDTTGLVDLGADRDGRVDGVGNDEQAGFGGMLGAGFGQVADDGGIGVEEIITGHARLSGNTSGDQNDVGALQGIGEACGSRIVARDSGLGVDMGDVGSNTCLKRGYVSNVLCLM